MTPAPRPLDPSCAEAAPAVLFASAALDVHIPAVLSEGTWGVVELPDGSVDVWFDERGLRAVALIMGDPRAVSAAERIIRDAGR